MHRRSFLASLAASLAVGCDAPERASGTPSTEAITGSTMSPTTSSTTPPVTAAVAGPAPSLTADPYPLGVASGDPDSTSVVLWTKAGAADPTVDVPMAWDVATDPGFTSLAASGRAVGRAVDGQTVRVIVDGLDPGRRFWYRFRIGDAASASGRTRTLPAQGAASFGLAFGSCQARDDPDLWDHHLGLAADPDVDLIVWLGDFIYDRGAATLDEYRLRYAECRGDLRLQASSAAHPWVCTWDDHEVANDYDASVDPERRMAGYTAWWEHQPTRLPRPTRSGLAVHRAVDIGDLARVLLLDCRQYNTAGTVLGDAQWSWLAESVDHGARHTILASPVVVSPLGVGELTPPYAFEAHPADAERLARLLAAAPGPLIVSGDLHLAMELAFTETITEWMAPPLSSPFPDEYAELVPFLPLVSPAVRSAEVRTGYLHVEVSPGALTPSAR